MLHSLVCLYITWHPCGMTEEVKFKMTSLPSFLTLALLLTLILTIQTASSIPFLPLSSQPLYINYNSTWLPPGTILTINGQSSSVHYTSHYCSSKRI